MGNSEKPPQRALVLGANGKLGRMIRRVWRTRPATYWQSRTQNEAADHSVTWALGDSPKALPKVNAIVALWGVTPGAGKNLDDNSALALAAMRLGHALGAERVLHCSSAAVYAPHAGHLQEADSGQEADTGVPSSAYGLSKLEMEQAVTAWQKRHPDGPKACMMRIGNVAGADSLFAALKRGGPVTLDQFDNHQGPKRSYIGPSDLGRCLEALLACPLEQLPGVVNISARAATAMEDLVHAAGGKLVWRDAGQGAVPLVSLATDGLRELIDLGAQASDATALVKDWKTYGELA